MRGICPYCRNQVELSYKNKWYGYKCPNCKGNTQNPIQSGNSQRHSYLILKNFSGIYQIIDTYRQDSIRQWYVGYASMLKAILRHLLAAYIYLRYFQVVCILFGKKLSDTPLIALQYKWIIHPFRYVLSGFIPIRYKPLTQPQNRSIRQLDCIESIYVIELC